MALLPRLTGSRKCLDRHAPGDRLGSGASPQAPRQFRDGENADGGGPQSMAASRFAQFGGCRGEHAERKHQKAMGGTRLRVLSSPRADDVGPALEGTFQPPTPPNRGQKVCLKLRTWNHLELAQQIFLNKTEFSIDTTLGKRNIF